MEKTTATIEQYLETFNSEEQEVMQTLIDLVYKVNPEVEYTV